MTGDVHYDDTTIRFLGMLWGEGYMSPGGAEEVGRVLEGIDLAGMTVLDIGSGSGGIAVDLVRRFGAAQVIGIDVEDDVCRYARERASAAGLSDRVEIRQVSPGPFPLEDASIDLVFSKDSIIHIPDKSWLAREVMRVLRPGGWFAASDWLISHDGEPSPEMARYIAAEDLDFAMASPERYRRALEEAGFGDIQLVNRNDWYQTQARAELERLRGPERPAFEAAFGSALIAEQVQIWEAMLPVVLTGEHCPHHLRGRKPA